MKKIITILTGAGMSAESGISTFRDSDGLWEKHDIRDVATPEGWKKNPALVLEFYNQRRRQLFDVQPNEGHKQLVRLEEKYDVFIVTQNVDDLHERAGSSNVLHLHGKLRSARSIKNSKLTYEWDKDINIGDLASDGAQLRPDIVWFGEDVTEIYAAADLVKHSDYIMVIGSSMQVYPAAGLVDYASKYVPVWYIDPNPAINHELKIRKNLTILSENATTGVKKVVDELLTLSS
jgi:NAD-dependent deacetylase